MSFNADGSEAYCYLKDDREEINIPLDNMAEYKELVELAQKQLNDLNETFRKLRYFNINMKITF